MKKKLLAVTLILGVILSFSGCINKGNNDNGEKLRVGVTISPLKDFTEAIGGDKVEVVSILPNGSDAHSFDPKPKDLKDLINTDMFIYNGLG
ncbi:ABC transporter substrate-binding protein, partial [Clostridium perfringens]|uniref:metal ABC transporter substrate-binding protein n=1 Tax=Clostridium perfringens TaxID=1502 RepID=UPI002AC63754